MRAPKLVAIGAALTAGVMVLGACTAASESDSSGNSSAGSQPTSVNIGWNQPFYSYNSDTSNGNATANANILYMMNAKFNYYDKDLKITPDPSFGTYKKVKDDPLTIKYTLSKDAAWSDGTPVDASDMLLEWAALSGNFNTLTADDVGTNADTGAAKPAPEGQVYFDASSPGLALVKDVPKISDDNRSLTLVYSKPFADWEQRTFDVGVPAHVTAEKALGLTDAKAAKEALVKAIQTDDKASLSKIANFWNTGFDYTSLPTDKGLYLSSGAYIMTAFKENEFMTLEKNPKFKGKLKASIDKVTIRWNEDPLSQVQALQNGELDMIAPQATADVLKAANAINGATVFTGNDATYEHVDLTFNNGGPFDPATYGGDADKAKKVRQAFLKTIPRAEILDKLIKPLNPKAEVRNSFNLTPGSPDYDATVKDNGSDAYKSVDIPGAQKLLTEAGVTQPVNVRFLYGKSNTRRANEYQLIADSAKQAGFNVTDNGDDNWSEKLGDKTYDAVLFGWQSNSTAVTAADANFRTGGQNNFGGYSSSKVDSLFDELQTETDPKKQEQINLDVEKELWADAFGTVNFQFPAITVSTKNLQNVTTLGLAPTVFYGFWEWKSGS